MAASDDLWLAHRDGSRKAKGPPDIRLRPFPEFQIFAVYRE
jgi:hypothetical protein